jgi:hypothetical protein
VRDMRNGVPPASGSPVTWSRHRPGERSVMVPVLGLVIPPMSTRAVGMASAANSNRTGTEFVCGRWHTFENPGQQSAAAMSSAPPGDAQPIESHGVAPQEGLMDAAPDGDGWQRRMR